MLVLRAQEAVFQARWAEQQAWERLAQAKAALQQRRKDGTGHLVELQIMQERIRK